jgi:sarcosine oxidase subunit gamma
VSGSSVVRLEPSATDIVEIAALRGRADEVDVVARRLGLDLPQLGRVAFSSNHMSLSVRPDRWLLLSPPSAPGEAVKKWVTRCAACAAAIDLSSALTAFELSGDPVRDMLARGCRLDLDAGAFSEGHAAATIMAQVSVILANLGSAMLLLTPSTTARHFEEWLRSTGRPFGLEP